MELMDELKVALHNLVKLEEIRDTYGKIQYYTDNQTLSITYARQVLRQCNSECNIDNKIKVPLFRIAFPSNYRIFKAANDLDYKMFCDWADTKIGEKRH